MIGDLFDSPLKLAILAVLIIVLFGSRKLPEAARSLGKSMRILKAEVQGLHEDEAVTTTTPVQSAPAQLQYQDTAQLQLQDTPPATPNAQAQIDALSKQLAELQRSVAANKTDTQA